MQVSLKATYAILAALDLAMHNGDSPVQAKSIAKRQSIPARFLEQVLNAMKKAGLVTSLRGAQGGYMLSKKPSELSLAEILEALDGPIGPHRGQASHRLSRRDHRQVSLLASVWDRVKQAELSVLASITVKELVDRQRELEQQHALMYHI
ncbi:MAG TPA: Rrf2 family transcriptional regulator [Nitrospiraceae bacterium]|jgi:Rrf2 family protein|nr:Rrf2 family transcriptional regulator [Nitrospiraceae bacterium]